MRKNRKQAVSFPRLGKTREAFFCGRKKNGKGQKTAHIIKGRFF